MRTFPLIPLALLSLLPTAAAAQVEVGDKPPALEATFIKGPKPDPTAADGKVYVVEFWATWCPPCRKSIPHLARIAREHEEDGLVVIGVSDEDEETVRGFEMLDQMTYHVACAASRKSYAAWMEGIDGIPHAFIVDQAGTVAWQGHPMDPGFERNLGLVLEKKFDSQAEKARSETLARLRGELRQAVEDEDVDEMMRVLDELIAMEPESIELLQAKIQLATQAGKPDVAREARKAAGRAAAGDPMQLNELAWEVLTDSDLDGDAIALAFAWAQRASDLILEDKDAPGDDKASVVDTLARAWYVVGRFDRAIELQEKAVELADSEESSASLARTLATYRKLQELAKSGPPRF